MTGLPRSYILVCKRTNRSKYTDTFPAGGIYAFAGFALPGLLVDVSRMMRGTGGSSIAVKVSSLAACFLSWLAKEGMRKRVTLNGQIGFENAEYDTGRQ